MLAPHDGTRITQGGSGGSGAGTRVSARSSAILRMHCTATLRATLRPHGSLAPHGYDPRDPDFRWMSGLQYESPDSRVPSRARRAVYGTLPRFRSALASAQARLVASTTARAGTVMAGGGSAASSGLTSVASHGTGPGLGYYADGGLGSNVDTTRIEAPQLLPPSLAVAFPLQRQGTARE